MAPLPLHWHDGVSRTVCTCFVSSSPAIREAKTSKSSRLSCISGGIRFRVKSKDKSLRLETCDLTVVLCIDARIRTLGDGSSWDP